MSDEGEYEVQSASEGVLTPNVKIDGPKVTIVLRNMISNALKFSPEHDGEVSLRIVPICLPAIDDTAKVVYRSLSTGLVLRDPHDLDDITPQCIFQDTTHFRVILSDSGRGMASEQQLQLFTKIVQFSPNENQKGGGSGIGLFLSHHIMRDHNVKIQVFSEGIDGRGTHFFMDIPRLLTESEKVTLCTTTNENYNYTATFARSPPKKHSLASSMRSSILSSVKRRTTKTEKINSSSRSYTLSKSFSAHDDDEGNSSKAAVGDHLLGTSGLDSGMPVQRGDGGATTVDPFSNRKTTSTMFSKIVLQKEPSIGPFDAANKCLDDLSVLVVDDSALNRKMLIRTFKQHNHFGKSFESISDGLKLLTQLGVRKSDCPDTVGDGEGINNNNISMDVLKNNIKEEVVIDINKKYDVIVLDDHMTDMNGSVAVRILRQAGYDGLVIGLTGSAMDEDLNAFCVAGVNYALPKPFVMDDLLHILKSHFKKK